MKSPNFQVTTLVCTDPCEMDLVAGYGSDSSGPDADAAPQPVPAVRAAPAMPTWASGTAKREQPAGLLDNLPAPSGQPKRKKRRMLPMTIQYVPDSDDEVQMPCFMSLSHTRFTTLLLSHKDAIVGAAEKESQNKQQGQEPHGLLACTKARLSFKAAWQRQQQGLSGMHDIVVHHRHL